MADPVSIHEAKTHLSRLVQSLRDGSEREVIISVGGRPAARLVPYEAPTARRLGAFAGLVQIADDFDADSDRLAELFLGTLS
jgi:prevent-host-death family protein